MTGGYNLANVAAAVAVGDYFGIPLSEALRAAADYVPDNNRSQVADSVNGTGNRLYRDAYNANPSSMAAALDNFLALPDSSAEFPGGKAVILGDMRELGEFSAAEHRAIVERLRGAVSARGTQQQRLVGYLVGPEFSAALDALGTPCDGLRAFDSVDALIEALAADSVRIRRTLLLVKGSRGTTLEKLYPLL